ncbi:MAG: VOC family protein [Deltaproteobacteria bacterium]|nr:VOC family protein [Deltaproteobacteria bacterium]
MIFNPLIPELAVSDFVISLDFYVRVLGFRVEYERPERPFAFLSYGRSQLMIELYNGTWSTGVPEYPFGRGMNLSIETDELDPLVARLRENAIPLMVEPEECWYRQNDVLNGERHILVQDPDGYALRFMQPLGTRPAV